MNYLIFMAGGSGLRFGADIPKQYLKVDDEPLFLYTLRKYSACPMVDKVVIVSNQDWIDYTYDNAKKVLNDKLLDVVPGGKTRSHSVKNGLLRCAETLSADDYVLIHDATNPFVDICAIEKALSEARLSGASVVGTNQYHTIYSRDSEDNIMNFIPRDSVGSGYSPEIFRFSVIYPSYKSADDTQLESMTSTVALAIKNNIHVKFVPADLLNIKITYPNDLKAFIAIKHFEDNI